jgi:hemerythrin-like domain-containing protein
MNPLLATLHEDHVNMAKLLTLLDQQLAVFRDGGTVDFGLLQDIMDYMSQYPDGVHHPREDLIARRLAERDPAAAADAQGLMAEHADLGDLSRRVHAAVGEIALGAELPREGVVQLVEDYADRLRHHMSREESGFFPLAERLLTDADWDALRSQFDAAHDPLFGDDVQEKFRSLKDSLLTV